MFNRNSVRFALIAGLVLAASACGSDDDSSSDGTAAPAATVATATDRPQPAGTEPAGTEPAGTEPAGTEPATEGTDAGSGQQVAETSGDGCTFDQYAGGVDEVDLASATIGFAQSETRSEPVPHRRDPVDP